MTTRHFQLFPALEPAVEAALRASIERFGVIVPVCRDQHGAIIDGYHRTRIADELGVTYPTRTIEVRDDDHARELARTLNMDRRHLSIEERRHMVAALSAEGHSTRAIAGALGVNHVTVARDRQTGPGGSRVAPATREPGGAIRGTDGNTYQQGAALDARREQSKALAGQGLSTRTIAETLGVGHATVVRDLRTSIAENLNADHAAAARDPRASIPPPEPEEIEAIADELEAWADITGAPVTSQTVLAAVAENTNSKRVPLAVPKRTIAEGIPPHPATYPRTVISIFRETIPPGSRVLDPFAGVGTIHQLRPEIETIGIEIEPLWAAASPHTICGNSKHPPFAPETFDVVATSPAYGNRLADDYNASDPQARRSYAIDLGARLNDDNGGGLHFARDGRYEKLHIDVWAAIVPLLRPGGLFLLNCKDFRRAGKIMRPTGWHLGTLAALGLRAIDLHTVPTAGLSHATAEPLSELVIVLRKDPS